MHGRWLLITADQCGKTRSWHSPLRKARCAATTRVQVHCQALPWSPRDKSIRDFVQSDKLVFLPVVKPPVGADDHAKERTMLGVRRV